MKIAVVTRYFPSSAEPWQGRSAYQTLRVLARHAEVKVFYPNASYPSWFRPKTRIYDRLDLSYRPPEVPVSYYNYPALPLVSRAFNGWVAARTLLPYVKAFAPDLIFGLFVYPEGFAALRIARALCVPAAVMALGSDINRIDDPISARHTRTVLRKTDVLLTVSDDLRDKAIAMGASSPRSRTVLNGCDVSVFCVRDRRLAREKVKIDPDLEAVVYVGRIDLKKGLGELVEAAAVLHPHRPNLHVYLVGNGADMALVEHVIQSRNSRSYIHIVPGCAFEEVADWMTASDLVTLPSYMEGCPNVVLEALACGRPVVATNVGGIPEIMNDTCGLLVPPRDSTKLSKAIAAVLDSSWDAPAISTQRSRSWEDVADEMIEIFDGIVGIRKIRR